MTYTTKAREIVGSIEESLGYSIYPSTRAAFLTALEAAHSSGYALAREEAANAERRAYESGARDMREKAARSCTSFLVGDPFKGVPLRNPMGHEISDHIRSLPLTDTDEFIKKATTDHTGVKG